MPITREYSFPSRANLENFMGLVNRFTGWSLEGFYPGADRPQSGRIRVSQSLPFVQAYLDWKTSGNTVTIDVTNLELHFDPGSRERCYQHLRQLAGWQGHGR